VAGLASEFLGNSGGQGGAVGQAANFVEQSVLGGGNSQGGGNLAEKAFKAVSGF